jgi:hypothetical protein
VSKGWWFFSLSGWLLYPVVVEDDMRYAPDLSIACAPIAGVIILLCWMAASLRHAAWEATSQPRSGLGSRLAAQKKPPGSPEKAASQCRSGLGSQLAAQKSRLTAWKAASQCSTIYPRPRAMRLGWTR